MKKYDVEKILLKFKEKNKSFVFLWPLLQLKVNPIHTYLGFKDMDFGKSLVVLLHNSQANYHADLKVMRESKFLDFEVHSKDGYSYMVFSFNTMPDVYDKVVNGQYSKIGGNARVLLTWVNDPLVSFGLYPETFYEEYAEQLEIPVESLKKGVELLPAPYPNNEYIRVEKDVAELLIDYLPVVSDLNHL